MFGRKRRREICPARFSVSFASGNKVWHGTWQLAGDNQRALLEFIISQSRHHEAQKAGVESASVPHSDVRDPAPIRSLTRVKKQDRAVPI